MNTNTDSNTTIQPVSNNEALHASQDLAAQVAATEQGMTATENYLFNDYDPKTPISVIGKRTSKLLYKTNPKTHLAAGKNSCVFLPAISGKDVESKLVELSEYLCGYLETVQDKMIRELHATGAASFSPDKVGIDSIISYLASTATVSRLSGDDIKAWFDSNMHDGLVVAFAESMSLDIEDITEEDLGRIEIVVGSYKSKFAMLASGKTVFKEEDIVSLTKAIAVCGLEEDMLGSRFAARLGNMKAKTDDMLLSL